MIECPCILSYLLNRPRCCLCLCIQSMLLGLDDLQYHAYHKCGLQEIQQQICIYIEFNCQMQVSSLPDPYVEYICLLYNGCTNNRFGKKKQVTCFEDLMDCVIINELLSRIQEFESPSLQVEPKTFAHYFSNLKETYKKMEAFWDGFLHKELDCGQIDLVDIAHHKNREQMGKILYLFVCTVVQSSQKEYFIQKILETSPSTQQFFMEFLKSTKWMKMRSPQKERGQRLYDKLFELEQENERLQIVISQICSQKLAVEGKNEQLCDKLKEFETETLKLRQQMSICIEDIRFREANEVINDKISRQHPLHARINQMKQEHENELSQYQDQFRVYQQKMAMVNELQHKLELYSDKLQTSEQIMNEYAQLNRKYEECKHLNSQQDHSRLELEDKVGAQEKRIAALQEELTEKQTQIEKYQCKLLEYTEELSKNAGERPSLSAISLRRTLSEHCPDAISSEAESLFESLKKLRQELQRASTTIKEKDSQLEHMRKQCEIRNKLELQNRKLCEILESAKEEHEDQTYLLLGSMYELRMRYLKQRESKENTVPAESGRALFQHDRNKIYTKEHKAVQ